MHKVLLGFEIGTGEPVHVPILHMAVTGQTQQSGKTTTLEALIRRSGLRAVTFITKRAESAFETERRIPAYFRERADWEFVSALLEATLRERMKFERSWIMRVCKGAKTLRDVQANVRDALSRARRGMDESVYITLNEYLAKVVPQIERLPYSDKLDLEPGVNAIDVSEYSSEMQALVIRSVLEWVYERERDVIVIVPEAWEFIPQKRNSPVKLAAEELIRKGAAAGNYVWLDSQDIAGVAKEILKQVSVWILGVQREANEVKRTLAHLPAGAARPKVEKIMTLGRGEFYVSYGRELRRVYVQPWWLEADKARIYAMEELPASFVARPPGQPARASRAAVAAQPKPAPVIPREASHEVRPAKPETAASTHKSGVGADETKERMYREQIDKLIDFLGREFPGSGREIKGDPVDVAISLLRELKAHCLSQQVAPAAASVDVDSLYAEIKRRLMDEQPALLQLAADKPELNVTVTKRVIEADGGTLRGRLALLMSEGYFDDGKTGNSAYTELQRRGFGTAKPNVYRELDKLAEWGFLTKETSGGYQAVPGMKVNVREVQAA